MATAPVQIGGANRARSTLVGPARVATPARRLDIGALQSFAEAGQLIAQIADERLSEAQAARRADQSARDAIVAAEASGAADRRMAEAVADMDPLAADFEQTLRERLEGVREEVLGETEFATAETRQALELSLTRGVQLSLNSALSDRRTRLEDEAVRKRGEALDTALASVRQDPGNAELFAQEFQRRAQAFNAAIPPERRRALAESDSDQLIMAEIEGLALGGRLEEARALTNSTQGQIGTEAFRFMKRRITEIENNKRSDFLSGTAAQVQDIRIGVVDAQSVGELRLLRNRVETLRAGGFFRGREEMAGSLIREIETKRQRLVDGQKDLQEALGKFRGGTGLDDQDEADLVWQQVATRLEDATPERLLDHVGEFTAEAGFLPTAFKRLVENAERTDDPEVLASGARIYDRVKQTGLESIDTGANERGSRVRLASAVVGLQGVSYEDAARTVNDSLPDSVTLKARREQFDADFGDFDARDFLRSKDAIPEAILGVFGETARIPAPAAVDFEKMLRLHYELTGDPAVAEEAALKRFQEVYGATRIGGQLRMAKMPAERFFPGALNRDLDDEEKAAVLEGDITRFLEVAERLTGEPMLPQVVIDDGAGGDTSDLPAFSLVADEVTLDDIARGRRPRYQLRVRDTQGMMAWPRMVMEDGTTQRLRYQMPGIKRLQAIPEFREITDPAERRARERFERIEEPRDTRPTPRGPPEQPERAIMRRRQQESR